MASGNLEILEPDRNEGYLDWRLPCTRDEEVADFLSTVGEGQAADAGLRARHADVLLVFAERMATLARRRESPRHLSVGLEAVALGALLGDSREAVQVMSLLWKTAEALELDPAREFSVAAERYEIKELYTFMDRSPEDRSIESMGYVETQDEFGFRYERTW